MSDLRSVATTAAQSLPLSAEETPRSIARTLQAPLLEAAGGDLGQLLAPVDRRFAARVSPWESRATETPRRPRLVTPWPDILGALAVGWAMASAAGMGRLTGGTDLNSLPVVAPTVIVSYAIAFVLFAVGAGFVRRERPTLLAEYEDSRAVTRDTALWTSVIFAAVCLIAMVIRLLTDEGFPLAFAAAAVSAIGLLLTVLLAIAGRRLAKATAAGGKFIHRPRATTDARRRYEAISASEDARDEAAAALDTLSQADRGDFAEAYAAAVAEVAARRILPAKTITRLQPGDWIAARYDVEV